MSMYGPTKHQSIVPPPESEFTPITCRNGRIICSGLIDMFLTNLESGRPPPATFQDYIELWIQALKEGRVTIASDGLVKSQTGTYAVIFWAGKSEICFHGPVDCHTDLLQLYWVELTGILAAYYLVQCFKTFFDVQTLPKLMAYVDNISAVKMNNFEAAFPGVTAHTGSDVDLLLDIWRLKAEGIDIQTEWVEAHQDTKYSD
eukprot:12713745-Ditylum_brightwellii.AAC.1